MSPLPRSLLLIRAVACGLCLLPLIPACGGRSDTEDYLFGANPTGATGAGASSPGTGASTGNDPGQGDGDPGSGANGSGANGSGANGSGANGSGATSAQGGESPDPGTGGTGTGGASAAGGSGVAGTGSAGAPAGTPVSCGDTSCDSSKQYCCAGLGGFGCVAKNQDCNGTLLRCSSTDDCNGNTVCCLRVIDEQNSGSQCKASCQGMGPGRERQLCRSDDECPFGHCLETVFGVSVCTRR